MPRVLINGQIPESFVQFTQKKNVVLSYAHTHKKNSTVTLQLF